jgi:hypothetical protein
MRASSFRVIFLRSLSELSGPWVGFWIQQPVRGWMKIDLSFAKGRIAGGGSDQIGTFRIAGRYHEDGTVEFTKRYRPWHKVIYTGRWDGQMIFGTWLIRRFDSGEFEIWPEAEFESLGIAEQESERELTPV